MWQTSVEKILEGKKMYDTGECIWLKHIGAVNQWRSSIAHVRSRGVGGLSWKGA